MAEPEDPENPDFLPTQPWVEPSSSEPFPGLRMGNSPLPQPRRGRWQPPSPQEVQSSFPQYEIVEILGRGGMGAVYKGWQKSLHRYVAIKILPPGIETETTNYGERFQREARAMARFQHPGIVAVHDAGETPEGLLYFVMEYIEGTDVQKMMAEDGRMKPERALAIAVQVCDALAYAHKNGVIHRDIKPSNIMVDRHGAVKVADFGLAKVTTGDRSLLTGTHMTMGTPDFMAPEAMTGMENVDERADVYALGVMLYQMLTGEVPRGRFELPSIHTPGLDVRFDTIVDRAMQKSRERRYPDANELRKELDCMVGRPLSQPLTLAPPIPNSAAKPPSGRDESLSVKGENALAPVATKPRRPIYFGIGIAATALLAAAFFLTTRTAESDPKARPALGGKIGLLTATKERPFTNSLGMQFVPVPITGGPSHGQRVLFSIWETRVQDFKAFTTDQNLDTPEPRFAQPKQPAVNVTWDEARIFCDWLTTRERKAGLIAADEVYRLPTDHEWSCAVGLGERENPSESPEKKHLKVVDVFPWGTEWPPAAGAGNYGGEEMLGLEAWRIPKALEGYHDGYVEMAPVGSFAPNRFGLYDLGGNAHEWCDDFYRPGDLLAVLRGASFVNESRENLLASYRLSRPVETRSAGNGFRVALSNAPLTNTASTTKTAAAKPRP